MTHLEPNSSLCASLGFGFDLPSWKQGSLLREAPASECSRHTPVLLVVGFQTIILMAEPAVHLLFHHPFQHRPGQDVSDRGVKAGVKNQIPGVAILRDATHDPGAMSGTDEHLLGQRRSSWKQGMIPSIKQYLATGLSELTIHHCPEFLWLPSSH